MFGLARRRPGRTAAALFAGGMLMGTGSAAAKADSGPIVAVGGDAPASAAQAPECKHAYAFLADPKYPPDFEHFDWVNPNAPKGGLMRVPDMGNWDSFNTLGLGRVVRGVDTRTPAERHNYDSLVIQAPDEVATVYGLLAECIAVAPDGAWIEYRLRREARWHDGVPVSVDDVVFSYHAYRNKANPALATRVEPFSGIEITGERTVRYLVAPAHRSNRVLPIKTGELPIMPKHYWEQPGHDIGKTTVKPPLGSGPYRIGDYDIGRWIEWRRVPDYWGKDLPVNRGRYNLETVKYDYFRDDQMQTEAVKGNAIDIHVENVPRRWATAYETPAVAAGHFRLEWVQRSDPAGLWWPIFWNLEQPRFQDIRVREALWLLNDFTWGNRRGGYGFFDTATSYFHKSHLASTGLPSKRELRVLAPIRHLVPPRVFTEPYRPPPNPGSGWHRENLLRAAQLFREAGWVVENNRLVHERTGEPFLIRFVAVSPALGGSFIPYTRVLKRLGIESSIKSPEISNWLYRMRSGDFDAGAVWFLPDNPPTMQIVNRFSSASADQPLSDNWPKIRDPAVDALIDAMQAANTYEDYVAAVRALDRVLLWNFYYVPGMSKVRIGIAYWDRYGQPPSRPLERNTFVDAWWWDAEKAAAVAAFTGRE